jgi:hypothetical protein
MTLADKIISYNKNLEFIKTLPEPIKIMNPFKEKPEIIEITKKFYHKFYNDSNDRYLILGINPGRFGAGLTGIPFTDKIRLNEKCGIQMEGQPVYETSSEFIYDVIDSYGGVEKFYSKFYINSVCPLGLTTISKSGRTINCNYYENEELTATLYEFILTNIKKQVVFGVNKEICYCLGSSDNYLFLNKLNKKENIFKEIIPLAHPRYVMQYKRKFKENYINKYLENLL